MVARRLVTAEVTGSNPVVVAQSRAVSVLGMSIPGPLGGRGIPNPASTSSIL